MRLHLLLLVIGMSALLERVSGGTFCFPDQKLTADGECVDCAYCPSGEGVVLNEEMPVNSDGIALECRTCKPCQQGYWNNQIYGQMECMKCRLNCLALNRKEYKPCGGSIPGLCGACINSNYEDMDNNIESPCVEKLTSTLASKDFIKLLAGPENHSRSEHTIDEPVAKLSEEAGPSSDDKSLEIGQAASLSLAGVLFIALLFIARYHWKHRTRNDSTKCSPIIGTSGDTLLSKDSSLLEVINYSTKHGPLLGEDYNCNKQDLSKDKDLETDTLHVENEMVQINAPAQGPRPELPSNLPSSGPGCITNNQKSRREYPKYILKIDDDFVRLASKHIYDEGKYKPMFRDLGISEQDLHAQYELFYHQKHDYDYMIRCLLNKWIKTVGQGATMDVLCGALDDHEFNKISIELLDLFQRSLALSRAS